MPVTDIEGTDLTTSGPRRRRRKAQGPIVDEGRRSRRSFRGDTPGPDPAPRSHGTVPMWRRLVARIIDVVAVMTWVFALSIAHVFLHLQLWSNDVAPAPWGNWFLATMTFAVCYAAYEIVFVAKTGATPGKDLMRVRVVDHVSGARPTFGQAARRWLLPGLVQPIPGPWIGAGLTLVWGGTGFTNADRRAVHDHLAGTRVVMADPPKDQEEEEHRRRQYTPRFVDPFAVFRLTRVDPAKLRQHPADHDKS